MKTLKFNKQQSPNNLQYCKRLNIKLKVPIPLTVNT